MVGIFYVLAWRREKSDFKLRISGIADSYMPMAYRERRWWGGWNADLSFQVKTNPECCGSVDLAANGSQRRVADRSRCIRIYRRIRTTKIWLVQYQHNPQLSAPIRDSRHMPEGIWIRDEFLSVILCNIKRSACHPLCPRPAETPQGEKKSAMLQITFAFLSLPVCTRELNSNTEAQRNRGLD